MDTLKLLRDHQHEAEIDAAVWIDNKPALRRLAGFLAHHRVLRVVALILASPALAVAATVWAVREAGRVIDRTHEVAGEDGKFCPRCTDEVVNADTEALRAASFSYADFVALCELADGGLL